MIQNRFTDLLLRRRPSMTRISWPDRSVARLRAAWGSPRRPLV